MATGNAGCTVQGFYPMAGECPAGLPNVTLPWKYMEVAVVDDSIRLRGHTDGILIVSRSKYVYEFKTVRSRYFDTLAEPLEGHAEQAATYVVTLDKEHKRLAKEGGQSPAIMEVLKMPFAGAVICYMNKDTQELQIFTAIITNNFRIYLYSINKNI
jgi:hypothetical protein